jgi:formylglycine-generating enzyme required for sulfatase activity
MNGKKSPRARCFAARSATFLLAVWCVQFSGHAQSALGIRLTPTLSVTGTVGSWQQIQYSDEPSNPTNWTPLTNLLLTQSPTIFTDTSGGAPRRFYRSVTLVIAANTNLVWIPPGTFLMGSPSNEPGRQPQEGPQTQVTLTQGFFVSKFEVTQSEYVSVMGGYPVGFLNSVKGNSLALGTVLWQEAVNYCDQLTQRELAAFRIPPGWAYRLPIEAEWEYACRAGTITAFGLGNALYNTPSAAIAWFHGTTPYPPATDPTGINPNQPTTVGSFPTATNAFGLCDMHGNVAEWCQDGAVGSATFPIYPGGSVTNPVVGVEQIFHILRGGSFGSDGAACRSAVRMIGVNGLLPFGFRVVLAPTGS